MSNETVYMLNMLCFHKLAQYPEQHDFANRGLSGAEAYQEYGRLVFPMVQALGGNMNIRWQVDRHVVSADDTEWDQIFVVRYPSRQLFKSMITSEAYQQAFVHREAAIKTSWVIQLSNQQFTE